MTYGEGSTGKIKVKKKNYILIKKVKMTQVSQVGYVIVTKSLIKVCQMSPECKTGER